MNCRRAQHLLFDFFDGLGNESMRAELDRHLGDCEECARFATEMTRSLSLLHHAPVEPLDENFNWKVRLAIHRERNTALSRSHTAGAWVRAWNLRYALSSGLAFGAVLVAGAVMLSRGGDVPGTPVNPVDKVTVASPMPERPVKSLVPGVNMMPVRNGASQLVAAGGDRVSRGTTPTGAIDESKTEATIDSLIAVDVMRMSPQERMLYIKRRIERLNMHLPSQQEPAVRP